MRTTFGGGLKHDSPMTLAVFAVSGTGVTSSGKGEKTSITILGRVSYWSASSMLKSCQHWKERLSILKTHLLRSCEFVLHQIVATCGIHVE
jgi:hypothetical protein